MPYIKKWYQYFIKPRNCSSCGKEQTAGYVMICVVDYGRVKEMSMICEECHTIEALAK